MAKDHRQIYPEAWARFAAILMFFGFNFTFFPQFIAGYLGMPRRYHVYPPEFQVYNVLSSAGAFVLAAAYLLPLFYLTWSAILGRPGPATTHGMRQVSNGEDVAAAAREFCRDFAGESGKNALQLSPL